MIVTTTDKIEERKIIETIGIVKGTIVQSKNIGRDFMAGMKNLVGGEVKSYTQMISEAREVATERMIEEATKLGADAIIGMRYGSSAIMQGMAEIIAYGTAVKLEK
ncbi:MAG: YbjQ family protein [Bacilli bacterium]|nr:YbjQ family protein [Bacilli bacterium]